MRSVFVRTLVKQVFMLILILGLAFSVSAQDVVTIEYWHINSAILGAKAVEQSVARFQELNPNIKVIERFQEGDYGGLLNNLQAAIAAGNPPAVAQVGYNFRLFAFEQLPHKLIADFAATDPDYAAYLESFIEGIPGLGQDGTGLQRAIPLAISVPVLYYNADLFKAAGLDPDQPPRTWDELREAALTIKRETGEYGLGIQVQPNNNWLPQSMIESNGGWILDPQGLPQVSSPEVVEVYELWQKMAIEDQSLPVVTDTEQEQAFMGGRLGMYLKTSAAMKTISNQAAFDLRTGPFPSWGDKQRRLASGGNALFIFAKDEVQQQAAYEFIKFLTSKEGQTIWVLDTGYLPLAQGVQDDPKYLADYFAENPLTKAALDQLPNAVAWLPFPGPRGFEAEQVLVEAREAILNGEPVQAALENAQSRLERLLN
ncbi:MAG: ABC transporter substrate-binding protein [Firmicutes bacterium]|nr:ABC transporter substrate-binding protein [Bacillota bacterium]